ncbi:MAG: SLC13 family permease [Methylococcales bacterium]
MTTVAEQRPISDARRIAETLAQAREFTNWPHPDLVQIVPYIWERRFAAGEILCRAGQTAEYAFCLMQGTVRLTAGAAREVSSGFVGHEAAMNVTNYLSDIVAVNDVVVLVLPGKVFYDFGITLDGDTFYHSLLARYTTPRYGAASEHHEEPRKSESITTAKAIGWFLALVVPASILYLGSGYDLNLDQMNFLAALSVCLLILSFALTAQYAAVLIAGLFCLLLDVAPTRVILSGFASDGFFIALSIFGFGAVLTYSGLADRMVLNILKRSPQTAFWYNISILLTGVLLTPCLPSANARIALMTPLVMGTSRALGFKDKSREGTRLMLSMFVGCSLFAPIFLTAKSLNFVVYSQMPAQIHDQFHWLKWTTEASFAGLDMLVFYVMASSFVFRGGEKPRLSRKHLEAQLCLLGPMKARQWTALATATLFIVAIMSYSVHKISPAWITLGVFCAYLILGTLNDKNIRHDLQWDVLLLVGFFIGLENTLDYLGMTAILTSNLSAVSAYMASNFELFIILMAAITWVLRLFLPITTAGVLIASVFLPLASFNGVNAWVVGFVILILSETWWLPAQCSYFLTLEELSGHQPVHDRKLFLRMNALSMVIRLIALGLSLPVFRSIGLL